jgi:excisionase family DNA binding protein
MKQLPEKVVFNRQEAASYLGMSQNTLAKLLNNGTIPHIRVGHKIIVPKTAIDQWLMEASQQKGGTADAQKNML